MKNPKKKKYFMGGQIEGLNPLEPIKQKPEKKKLQDANIGEIGGDYLALVGKQALSPFGASGAIKRDMKTALGEKIDKGLAPVREINKQAAKGIATYTLGPAGGAAATGIQSAAEGLLGEDTAIDNSNRKLVEGIGTVGNVTASTVGLLGMNVDDPGGILTKNFNASTFDITKATTDTNLINAYKALKTDSEREEFARNNKLKFKDGGVLKGNSHAKGGIKGKVKETGKEVEMEGDEIVLTKGVYRDPQLRGIASAINVAAGGKPIVKDNNDDDDYMQDGGVVNSGNKEADKILKDIYSGKYKTEKEIKEAIKKVDSLTSSGIKTNPEVDKAMKFLKDWKIDQGKSSILNEYNKQLNVNLNILKKGGASKKEIAKYQNEFRKQYFNENPDKKYLYDTSKKYRELAQINAIQNKKKEKEQTQKQSSDFLQNINPFNPQSSVSNKTPQIVQPKGTYNTPSTKKAATTRSSTPTQTTINDPNYDIGKDEQGREISTPMFEGDKPKPVGGLQNYLATAGMTPRTSLDTNVVPQKQETPITNAAVQAAFPKADIKTPFDVTAGLGLVQTIAGLAALKKDGTAPVYEADAQLAKDAALMNNEAKFGYDSATMAQMRSDIELTRRMGIKEAQQLTGGDAGLQLTMQTAQGLNTDRAYSDLGRESELFRLQKRQAAFGMNQAVAQEKKYAFENKLNLFNTRQQAGALLAQKGIENTIGAMRYKDALRAEQERNNLGRSTTSSLSQLSKSDVDRRFTVAMQEKPALKDIYKNDINAWARDNSIYDYNSLK